MNSVVISDYEQGHFAVTKIFVFFNWNPFLALYKLSVCKRLWIFIFRGHFPIFFHFFRSNEFHTASWWQKLKHRCSAIWAKCRFFRDINEIYINSLYDTHYEPYYPMGKLIGIRFKPSKKSVFASIYEFSFFEVILPYFSIFFVQTNSIQLLNDKNIEVYHTTSVKR